MTNQTEIPALAEATLVFDSWSSPPLTENQRMGWRQRHGIVRVVRRQASFKARQAGLSELGVCRATLTWFVNTRTRRDADNIVPTLKGMCDGLVDAGVVTDDIPELMDKAMPRIVYEQGGTPRLELHVERIDPSTVTPPATGPVVYVAGPMSGIADFNYPAFNAAAAELTARGFRVLNPVDSEDENETGGPQAWDWYMRRALRMVTTADGLALLDGAHNSRGARLERQVAEALGLDVRPLAEWLA